MTTGNLPRPKRWARKVEVSDHVLVGLEVSLRNIRAIHERVLGEEGYTCATCASLDLVDPLLYPCPTATQADMALEQLGNSHLKVGGLNAS